MKIKNKTEKSKVFNQAKNPKKLIVKERANDTFGNQSFPISNTHENRAMNLNCVESTKFILPRVCVLKLSID